MFYLRFYGRKEGNVLFNDALNTFLIWVCVCKICVLFHVSTMTCIVNCVLFGVPTLQGVTVAGIEMVVCLYTAL